MRVGILALLHESNTFVSDPTRLENFKQNVLAAGEEVREQFAGMHHEISGYLAGLEEAGIEAVPIYAARALPSGTVTAETHSYLVEQMLEQLRQAGPLDGLLTGPHGATVSEEYGDADGHWLSEVRKVVGPDMPIICTADAHANISSRMAAAIDALIGYRTNPHIDQFARGKEAAELMARTLRGEVRPTMAIAFPPLVINIERQHTTEEPCLSLIEEANNQRDIPGVLTNSLFLGFPYADVEEMGSALVVVTDNDPQQAEVMATELARSLWARRDEFAGQFIDVESAIDQAVQLPGPVCLLDMGDNVGGGSPADGTFLAHALHRRKVNAFVCICDAEAVRQADQAGAGAQLELTIGGHTDEHHGEPLTSQFTVVSLHDGVFEEPEPRHGGFTEFNQGRTAVVRTEDGLTVMLTSRRMTPFSLHQLTDFDVDPGQFQIIVAKGVNAPVAAYAPVCPHLLRVDTPGVTTADMRRLAFHKRRRPMFPFETDFPWTPGAELFVRGT